MTATMGLSWVFVVILYLFLGCNGFLFDDRNKLSTTSVSSLTDQHYNALFNLIVAERQSRSKLEQQLERLEQELIATEKGVTDIYHTSANNNATLEVETKNWNIIRTENNDLKDRYNLLEYKFNSLARNHSNLENYTKVLEQEVASLKQLKGVTDLQTVLNVRNETNILREELKITKNSLNSVRNEAEARKQDFVALLNKADSIEHKLDLSVKSFDDKLEYQHNRTKFEMKLMQDQMQMLGEYENQTVKNLHESLAVVHGIQNVSVEKLDMEINNMSNRTALTSCMLTSSKLYTRGSIILFSNVKTRFGINDSSVAAFISSGKFQCKKPGLYLISAFVMTESTGYQGFNVYRNNDVVAAFFPSVNDASSNYQTSTFLILQYLDINDSFYIITREKATIWGENIHSCISFIQLTTL